MSLPSTAPVRVLPGLPMLGLGRVFEPALGRLALVQSCCSRCRSAFHARSVVETLWAWIVSFTVLPCAVVVRSLAVYGVAGGGFLTASGLSEIALA